MNDQLERFIPFVQFLGQSLGKNYEVVLHDLSTPETSIIAIANGELSGRVVGGPTTDFALKILQRGAAEDRQYLVNYHGKNINGNLFKSSSYFLRDDEGRVIGALCINMNLSPFISLKNFISKEIICEDKDPSDNTGAAEKSGSPFHVFENFQGSIDEVISSMIDTALVKYDIAPERLSASERITVVEDLNESGLFLLKGGLAALAERLNVSEPTIYRYLSKVKRNNI